MTVLQQKMYDKAKQQNDLLCKIYERTTGPAFVYEKTKQIGYLDMLDIAGIDRSEFNWIFQA